MKSCQSTRNSGWCLLLLACLLARADAPVPTVTPVPWQQVSNAASFTLFPDREEYSTLDRQARFILATQVGRDGPALERVTGTWTLRRGETQVAGGEVSLATGLVAIDLPLAALTPGRYDLHGTMRVDGVERFAADTFFRYVEEPQPPQVGQVELLLPRGLPLASGSFPVTGGVPFPKGALWDAGQVSVTGPNGEVVRSQATVRSRWGSSPASSIRWLGIDFQAETGKKYVLNYGLQAGGDGVGPILKLTETDTGIGVDTGPLRFNVSRRSFNLFSGVMLNGQTILPERPNAGLYLIDHEGSVYRAANDREVKLAIEEQGPLRAVIRAEGWYVKDGTAGESQSYTLPTDKLCKFVCRLEVYAGKPYVRLLSTWIVTADTFSVRFRDLGLELPLDAIAEASFGIEDDPALTVRVGQGIRLVQHLPSAFVLEQADGTALATGTRSAGWMTAASPAAAIAIGHRDTWQRFPKELEVLPTGLRLHLWPAHGKEHPEIDPVAPDQIHRLWFAHQGTELNLAQPWETYFRVAQILNDPSQGVYNGAGLALAGIHASGMGAAITSDLLVHFATDAAELPATAACFQAAPQVLADPAWACASLAMGWVHPRDPEHFGTLEEIIDKTMRGYWETQNNTGEYGMWLYRPWHHATYEGEGRWHLYRLYNATHHYEAFMPWLFYARSGDPFYFTQGMANIRQLTDVMTIHYDDPAYPHKEFHFGQGRLVGSTRHTNGFNTWGGDHAVLAHLTCYNAAMLAYYLTGDLRLREVVVDEWQQTLLTDRANPQFAKADRSGSKELNGARDTSNALAELLDLYQLTYEPALLAHIAPMLDIFLNYHMRHWGQPLHNVLLHYKSQQAADQLLAAVEEHRATLGKPADPKTVWYTHSPHENWALAAILRPDAGYQVDAYFASNPGQWQARLPGILEEKGRAVTWCTVPDLLLYLPRVQYAIAHSQDGFALDRLDAAQPFPASDTTQQGWTRIVVNEAADHAWPIQVMGSVGSVDIPVEILNDGIPLQVFGPDGRLVVKTVIPSGNHAPWRLTVPADELTGQYVILIKARDVKDNLRVPLTDLPEVYCLGYWSQLSPSRFFIRAAGDQPEEFAIQPHKSSGQILSADAQTSLASTATGELLTATIDAGGAWVMIAARYTHPRTPSVFAVGPDRWFNPSPEALAIRPAP